MTIRFRCPHCKKPLSVKDHLAGKKANCLTCKKALVIPSPVAPTSSTAIKAPADKPGNAAAPPELSPAELEELAAAALNDESASNGKQAEEPAATVDFKCEFCEHEIHAPRADVGKRMQCPNPECRSIVKVPALKEDKPKDWRELAKKGPTVAQMTQPDKIDEAAWGTQTDKVRAGSAALMEAGALPAPKKAPVGVRGWIQRGMLGIGIAGVLTLVFVVGTRVHTVSDEKEFVGRMRAYLEPAKGGKPEELIKDPAVRAEGYRAIAEYKIRSNKQYTAMEPLQQALASLSQTAAKSRPIEHDLVLIEVALTITELGGSEDDETSKLKWNWKGRELRNLLQSTLDAIAAPEARAMAMRALTTRLLEKDQASLATGLASQLSNNEGGRAPPATSQLVVLLLLQDGKGVDQLVKAPSIAKEVPHPLARVGYAEFHTRKGNLAEAQELAFAKGPPLEQLEACVGVAQVILGKKNARVEEAAPFVDKALDILQKPQKVSPWQLIQTIRVVARVKGNAAVPSELLKQLPPAFAPRGYLELVLADADASTAGALASSILADIKTANPDSPSLDFGWEALARQNMRVGANDVELESREPENLRFRPMVHAGRTLGAREVK